MAHFYGVMRGSRDTETTKAGDAKHGIDAQVKGWTSGVRVIAHVNSKGEDCFAVYATHGSAGVSEDIYLGEIIRVNGCIHPQWFPMVKS